MEIQESKKSTRKRVKKLGLAAIAFGALGIGSLLGIESKIRIPTKAQPAKTESSSQIVISGSKDNKNFDLYLLNEEGEFLKKLTSKSRINVNPMWSPDGKKILFYSTKDGNQGELYTINPDGSSRTRITNNNFVEKNPRWSPNSRSIAFSAREKADESSIFTINSDGTGKKKITKGLLSAIQPEWSPDGEQIVFVGHKNYRGNIYVIDSDGSNMNNLTKLGITSFPENFAPSYFIPKWSPDGKQIAFHALVPGRTKQEVHIMNSDGSNQRNLTNNPTRDTNPEWSPDGKKIAYTSGDFGERELYLMNANGENKTRLTNLSSYDIDYSWSPDGGKLSLVSFDNSQNVRNYIINVNEVKHKALIDVSTSIASDGNPATWNPKNK